MAMQAHCEYDLEEVWLIPAGHSPNKDEANMAAASDRIAMAELAIGVYPDDNSSGFLACNPEILRKQYSYMKVSAIEVNSDEISYTYRTLQKLCDEFPMHTFSFIMGADSLDYFDKWMHPELICERAQILVVNRDQFFEQDLRNKITEIQEIFPADIRIVHCEKYDISSSEIRALIQAGEDYKKYLPADVAAYIQQHHLYQNRI